MRRYRGRHAAAKSVEFTGPRLRRGVSTAAIAAAAMAALTASQAPGLNTATPSADEEGGPSGAPRGEGPGDDSYHTELPPLESPDPEGTGPGGEKREKGEAGIPATVLDAYKKAEGAVADSNKSCELPWELLAAIGKVESGQARGGAVDSDGTTVKPILGPVLNGKGFAKIEDTDRGVYDGNATYDRAVGPMQFIPSTWARWGADGNGDGRKDPNNVYDAALASGRYLCAGERDLSAKADRDGAILSYNRSQDYLRTVLSWFEFYRSGVHEVPDGEGTVPETPRDSTDRPSSPIGTDPGGKPDKDKPGDKPGNDKPGDKPGDEPGDEDPGEDEPGDEDPTPSPDPSEPADFERASAERATVTAGEEFTDTFRTKVTNEQGKGVKDVEVRYVVKGDTDARFAEDTREVTVATDGKGRATAPELRSGERAGSFTVRAEVVESDKLTTDFSATVQEAEADELTRPDTTPMTAVAKHAFAEQVTVQATQKDEPVEEIPLTATVVTEDGKPAQGADVPFFKDSAGKPVHSLEGLKTGSKGLLTLPKMFAGEQAGKYQLRITTGSEDVEPLLVDLTVTEQQDDSASPSKSPSASPSSS